VWATRNPVPISVDGISTGVTGYDKCDKKLYNDYKFDGITRKTCRIVWYMILDLGKIQDYAGQGPKTGYYDYNWAFKTDDNGNPFANPGTSRTSEYRGISIAPRTCTSGTGKGVPHFRALDGAEAAAASDVEAADAAAEADAEVDAEVDAEAAAPAVAASA
jgi:hypothetical protein